MVSLDYDKVVQSAAPEVRNDLNKLASYLEEVRVLHEQVLSNLAPEDALVTYSLAEVAALKVTGEKAEISDLINQQKIENRPNASLCKRWDSQRVLIHPIQCSTRNPAVVVEHCNNARCRPICSLKQDL